MRRKTARKTANSRKEVIENAMAELMCLTAACDAAAYRRLALLAID
jgi:hypothetical protein